MPTVAKSAIVEATCEEMFALVDDVERYPEFLPWCVATRLAERTAEITQASIDIDYRGVKTRIATRNTKDPPRSMRLAFVEGPFERFSGEWTFAALGDAGCKVSFALDYSFRSRALEALLGPLFGHISETMVDSFVRRAEEAAGGGAA